MPEDAVYLVQRYYPQIYLACHVDHVRARTTRFRLSSADATLLVHLEAGRPITAGALAKHLGVAASSLSAALSRLEGLGYLQRTPRKHDRRQIELRLTGLGRDAISATSVLDEGHVRGVLACLAPGDRKRAVGGLALLAEAAATYRRRSPGKRTPIL